LKVIVVPHLAEAMEKGDEAMLHLAAGVLRKGVELTVEK
jgi:hypothetical protein